MEKLISVAYKWQLNAFQVMKYIVYFYVDYEVVEVFEDDVILGDFSSWTLSDWSNNRGLEHRINMYTIRVDSASFKT